MNNEASNSDDGKHAAENIFNNKFDIVVTISHIM